MTNNMSNLQTGERLVGDRTMGPGRVIRMLEDPRGLGKAWAVAEEASPAAPRLWRARFLRPRAFLAAALALAYLPYLVSYSDNLMQREHYQFFPLAWIGAIALLWARRDALRPRGDVAMPAAGWAGFCLGALLLGAAGALDSAWLAMISVLPMAAGMAWLAGGSPMVLGIVPALVMFVTTLRLPGSFDFLLIHELRTLAVGMSSQVLDAIGIIHAPSGNYLRVPGKDLLVDEACSGVNSLVSIAAVVLFLGLHLRRRPLHLALLVIGSGGIVVLANIARVSIVTIAYSRWQVDLLQGWKHTALGIMLYVASLCLAASLDHLLLLLASLRPRRSTRDRSVRASDPGRHLAQEMPRTSLPASPSSRGDAGPRSRRLLTICAPVLAAIGLIHPIRWAIHVAAGKPDTSEIVHLIERANGTLSEGSMPPELAGWRRVGFKTEQRDRDDSFGQHSACWQYRLGSRTALVSVDYAFRGWHELTRCYELTGWTVGRRQVQPASSGAGSGPSPADVSAWLSHPKGEHAMLRFGIADAQGQWLDPPGQQGFLGLAGLKVSQQPPSEQPTYQLQVFGSGYKPQGDEDQRAYDQLFEAARLELKRRPIVTGAITP